MKERTGAAAPRPGHETGAVDLALSRAPSRPAEVWLALSPADQQQIYRQIVIICRSLVGETPPVVWSEEVGYDEV
jgi:hypothetical protein